MYVAQPIEWTDRGVVMLDQRRLPTEEISHTYTTYQDVAKAIREMVIRGAPAIGVAAAMGVAITGLALTPPHSMIGVAAPILVVFFRNRGSIAVEDINLMKG